MNSPFGIFGRPNLGDRGQRKNASLEAEVREVEADEKRLASKAALANHDVIGKAIGATYGIADKVFPVLYKGACVAVSRFYPREKIVVDVLGEKGEEVDPAEIAFKRKLFHGNGMKYAAIWYKDEMAHLLEQLI